MTPSSPATRSPRARDRRAHRRALAVALAALVAVAACRGSGGPAGPDPSIAGNWSGTAELHTVHFSAHFTQSGDSVGGTGHVSSPLGDSDFTITGTVVGGAVDLLLFAPGVGTSGYRGRFTGADRIGGTLTAPSTDRYDLTIYRD